MAKLLLLPSSLSLKPHDNCVDVPKEVCTRARRNPRKIKRPIIKKWCYTPSEGLEGNDDAAASAAAVPDDTAQTDSEAVESDEPAEA